MVPEAWLREHHAYLQVMLRPAATATTSTSCTTTASTTCPVAMAAALPVPGADDPAHPADPLARVGDRASTRARRRGQSLRGRQRAHRPVVVARRPRRRRAQRRRRRRWAAGTRRRRPRVGRPDRPREGPAPGHRDGAAPRAAAAPRRTGRRRRLLRAPTSQPRARRRRAATSATSTPTACVAWSAAARPCSSRRSGTSPTASSPPSRWRAAPRWSPWTVVASGSSSSPGCGVLLPRDAGTGEAAQAVATAVGLDRADCRAHAVAALLGRRHGRAVPRPLPVDRRPPRCRVIGYYVHHHGPGSPDPPAGRRRAPEVPRDGPQLAARAPVLGPGRGSTSSATTYAARGRPARRRHRARRAALGAPARPRSGGPHGRSRRVDPSVPGPPSSSSTCPSRSPC